jgi:hypothetical protein
VLVLVARASLIGCLVTRGVMATVTQHRDGPGGAMVLVEASGAGGEGGELMDTLGRKF